MHLKTKESNVWRPVKRPTLFMLLTYLNRSVSTKLAVWKFCFYSLWLSFITKQDHDQLWNSQWSPNVISCKCIFEFLSKPDEQITPAVSATVSSFVETESRCCLQWIRRLEVRRLFVLICPQSAFLCAVWQLYLACSLFRTQQEHWHPQKWSYRGGVCPDRTTKQVDVDVYSFTRQL